MTIWSGLCKCCTFLPKIQRDWFPFFSFHQLLTPLLSTQSTRWVSPPSESAGPGLRLLLLVRNLLQYVCLYLIFNLVSSWYKYSFYSVCAARLPCGVHAVIGRQQHWAEPARLGDLSDPGWPAPRAPLQHQHLRCGGGPGEWACVCTGQHSWIPSSRCTFLNRYDIFQLIKKLKCMKT